MNEDLINILSGAGLHQLVGASKYSWRVRRIMKAKAPKYLREDALKKPALRIDQMTEGLISKDIQKKYGQPPVKRFDWVKAALRADKMTPEDKKWEEVHRPEYWGLEWAKDDNDTRPVALHPVSNGGEGKNWVNKDGIQFPPILWTNKQYFEKKNAHLNDKFWALRHIGGAPEKEKIRNAKNDKVERKRVRYNMLFFREDDMPQRRELPEFGNSKSQQMGMDYLGSHYASYYGKVERKTYNGVKLVGFDQVLAKHEKKGRKTKEQLRAEADAKRKNEPEEEEDKPAPAPKLKIKLKRKTEPEPEPEPEEEDEEILDPPDDEPRSKKVVVAFKPKEKNNLFRLFSSTMGMLRLYNGDRDSDENLKRLFKNKRVNPYNFINMATAFDAAMNEYNLDDEEKAQLIDLVRKVRTNRVVFDALMKKAKEYDGLVSNEDRTDDEEEKLEDIADKYDLSRGGYDLE
jgi:hypothetical protein